MRAKGDYTNFRASLTQNSKFWDFETKQELKQLMSGAGYRIKRIDGIPTNIEASSKQTDFAWNFLRGETLQKLIDDFVINIYANRQVYRSLKEQTIKGKKYRRGQFIPKKR